LEIVSDSMYAINSFSKWKKMWKLRGWKKADGKEPLNMDLIYQFDKLEDYLKNRVDISFRHIKAHTKEPKDKKSQQWLDWYANNEADKLAKKASTDIAQK